MNNITNEILAEYKNGQGSVKLSKLANAYMVSFMPVYGDSEVFTHRKQKPAEIDYSNLVNILMKGE